jgi:hypothetical protein
MTQPDPARTSMRIGRNDVWLQWPDWYRPECVVCDCPTIGLVDRGGYLKGGALVIKRTTAEPCGHELSIDQAGAMQRAAGTAGALAETLDAELHDAAPWRPAR